MQGGPNVLFYQTRNLNPSISLIPLYILWAPRPPCHVSNILLSHSFAGSRFLFPSFFVLFFFYYFIEFFPRFVDDVSFYSILYKYGFIAWSRVRVAARIHRSADCVLSLLVYGDPGISCSETWWCPGHFEVKKGENCCLLATGSPDLGKSKPP